MFVSQLYASLILVVAILCSPVHGETKSLGYKGQMVYTSGTGKPYLNYVMESDRAVTVAMMFADDYEVWKANGFEGAYKRIPECDCGENTLTCEKSCFLNPLKKYVLSFTNYDLLVPATVTFTDKGIGTGAFTIEDSSGSSLQNTTSGCSEVGVSRSMLVRVGIGGVLGLAMSAF